MRTSTIPVSRGGNCGIVEVLIVGRHADVELHAPSMQIRRQLSEQSEITRLARLRESLEVDHESPVAVRGKKHRCLAAKTSSSLGIVQEAADFPHPIAAVEVVDQ